MSSYSRSMNLRLHSHEFLFPSLWTQSQNASHEFKSLFPSLWTQDSDCIPMSSYSLPMNLRLHSMSSYLPANESQTAFHEFLFPCQIFGVFWLVPPMSCPSYFRNAHRRSKSCILTRFWGYPYTYHMGTPKIDCRAF